MLSGHDCYGQGFYGFSKAVDSKLEKSPYVIDRIKADDTANKQLNATNAFSQIREMLKSNYDHRVLTKLKLSSVDNKLIMF